MKKRKFHCFIIVIFGCMASLATVTGASEPQKPDVSRVFDDKKEEIIKMTSNLSSKEVLDKLEDLDFIVNEDFMNKAVYNAFDNRRKEGIELSSQSLFKPEKEFTSGKVIHRTRNIFIAKKVFENFPDESIPKLMKIYESGDAITKGNVVRVSGRLAGPAVTDLLIKALDDTTTCEQEDPEGDGFPMRICDLAYNQLVLRFQVKGVLRTIGSVQRIETRDYHIGILKRNL